MNYTRFDLEQLILKNWEITTEIKHLYEKVLDDDSYTRDQIANYLLGLETIYELKFNKLWDCFEQLTSEKKITN
jgi:hypothetical protein